MKQDLSPVWEKVLDYAARRLTHRYHRALRLYLVVTPMVESGRTQTALITAAITIWEEAHRALNAFRSLCKATSELVLIEPKTEDNVLTPGPRARWKNRRLLDLSFVIMKQKQVATFFPRSGYSRTVQNPARSLQHHLDAKMTTSWVREQVSYWTKRARVQIRYDGGKQGDEEVFCAIGLCYPRRLVRLPLLQCGGCGSLGGSQIEGFLPPPIPGRRSGGQRGNQTEVVSPFLFPGGPGWETTATGRKERGPMEETPATDSDDSQDEAGPRRIVEHPRLPGLEPESADGESVFQDEEDQAEEEQEEEEQGAAMEVDAEGS